MKEEYYSGHTHTSHKARPVEASKVQIVHSDQGELVVEYPVKSSSWRSDHRWFEARVALKRYNGSSVAYLVLDAVKKRGA